MAHHIVYVPGLGDHRSYGQDSVIRLWRLLGLRAQYMALGWNNPEGFDTKLKRLTDTVDMLLGQGHTVSLCGVSAGASAVLAAYAQRPRVHAVVTIAGKIQRPQNIGQQIRTLNPDFYSGAQRIAANVALLQQRGDTGSILCLYAAADTTVPPADAVIVGARKQQVPGWDHSSGIFFGITYGAWAIARFVKSV